MHLTNNIYNVIVIVVIIQGIDEAKSNLARCDRRAIFGYFCFLFFCFFDDGVETRLLHNFADDISNRFGRTFFYHGVLHIGGLRDGTVGSCFAHFDGRGRCGSLRDDGGFCRRG